ncbi:hypothetical protein WICPIJ_005192 [Wickerhamomyces pijperi]|uniref:UDP-N-acetylglucosamine transferase subunit ALG13 n=1 Tax=Wickerhamomyces pijperi TaxID=599730 RepID=A0A9P8Q3Z4_WICPI|nr:hypothetical protein WICPIJ_005192 [Wickerhamomyces pijperi]
MPQSQPQSKTVFVTTGATVTFPGLLRTVLNQQFIKTLKDLGYNKLKVQYGKEKDALDLFQSLIVHTLGLQLNEVLHTDGVLIEGIPFSNDVQQEIINSELVISHSGTGSILDSLRLKKKLIVVVNDALMDNHQLEIAQEFENGGYLLKCDKPDVDALIDILKEIQTTQLTELPLPKEDTLKTILESL